MKYALSGELIEFSLNDTLLGKDPLDCGIIADVSRDSIDIFLNGSRDLEPSKTEFKLIKKFNEISYNRLNKYVVSLLFIYLYIYKAYKINKSN